MNKENVVYVNNRIVFIHKNNDFLSFFSKMDGTGRHYVK
jgi:hypothetical protein